MCTAHGQAPERAALVRMHLTLHVTRCILAWSELRGGNRFGVAGNELGKLHGWQVIMKLSQIDLQLAGT